MLSRTLLFAGAVLAGFGLLSGCKPVLINPDDPYENYGEYAVSQSKLLISNTESPVQPLLGTLYAPDTPEVSTEQSHLVVLLPGFGASYQLYADYAQHLASHGYWVLGMDFAKQRDPLDAEHDYRARQVRMALDFIAAQPQYAAHLDDTASAVMGHSMGGKVAFYAASMDARIQAVVALDPVNAGGPPCFIFPNDCAKYPVAPNPPRGEVGVLDSVIAASLILRSSPDAAFNPEEEFNASWFYFGSDGNGAHAAPSPAVYFDMGAVGHADYLSVIPNDTVQITKRTALAFIEQQFNGVDNSTYFSGPYVEADIAAGRIVSVQQR